MKISQEEVRKLGEGQTVEFKKSLSLTKDALEALCGMINSDIAKGFVLFGVSPDGSISGIEPGNLDSAQKTLAQHIRQKFNPPVICTIEILECEDRCLIKLGAGRASGVAYHEYDGRAYIREGSTTRQLSYDEKQYLAKKRNRTSIMVLGSATAVEHLLECCLVLCLQTKALKKPIIALAEVSFGLYNQSLQSIATS